MEHFYINGYGEPPLDWPDDVRLNVESTRWWDLLRQFTALKNSKLQNIFLEGFQPSEPTKAAICQFDIGNHVDSHLIAVYITVIRLFIIIISLHRIGSTAGQHKVRTVCLCLTATFVSYTVV